jgi:hypothetical protein
MLIESPWVRLTVTVDRPAGKPTITFQHYGTDGKIYHEEELTAE